MEHKKRYKGSRTYRFLMISLSIFFSLLLFWLLGFILSDIGNQSVVSFTQFQAKYLDPSLVKKNNALQQEEALLVQTMNQQNEQLSILQKSINGYRETMNQLMDLQKSSLQKNVPFSVDSERNLKKITQLYLNYQHHFQELNQSISNNALKKQQLTNKIKDDGLQLSKQSQLALNDYHTLVMKHHLLMASLQMLVLTPLLFIGVYCYRKYRNSIYQPLHIAICSAIILKTLQVMHEHFPTRAFKYLLILILIYLVLRVLMIMLQRTIAPQSDWLRKQYQEAYQQLQCPLCKFAIQPGLRKFLHKQSHSLNASLNEAYIEPIERYTCPGCGEQLFEPCRSCSHTRHSLLPYCEHCGSKKQR